MRLNGQLSVQSNQLNNEQLESIKSEKLVRSKENEDAEKPDNKNAAAAAAEKVINQSGNDKTDNEDQTNLVGFF